MVSCLGLLVQSCCGEGGALQTNVTGLCGEHLQCSSHTGFTPAHWCVFSPSALLRLPAALYGVGPALRVVPVFGYSTKARTRLGLSFVPSPAQAAQQPGAWQAHSPLVQYALSPPWFQPVSARASRVRAPCVCSRELVSSRDPPGGCQPSRISGSLWLEAGSLFAIW